MKNMTLAFLMLFFLVATAQADQNLVVKKLNYLLKAAVSSAPATQSLADYLTTAYDLKNLKVEKSVIADPTCGDAYFVDLKVRSFFNYVQVEMDYYVQTLTQESQESLYSAIQTNYASKGLPKCLLQDQFAVEGQNLVGFSYAYNPDFTTVSVTVPTVPVPAGYGCSGSIERPLTSCWNVKDLYGK